MPKQLSYYLLQSEFLENSPGKGTRWLQDRAESPIFMIKKSLIPKLQRSRLSPFRLDNIARDASKGGPSVPQNRAAAKT